MYGVIPSLTCYFFCSFPIHSLFFFFITQEPQKHGQKKAIPFVGRQPEQSHQETKDGCSRLQQTDGQEFKS